MQKVRLYWEFYKSTLVLNLASSFFLGIILYMGMHLTMETQPSFLVVYIIACMFAGPVLCFFSKEMAQQKEYYFYYNRGIAKINLIIVTLFVYILEGILTLKILHYAGIA